MSFALRVLNKALTLAFKASRPNTLWLALRSAKSNSCKRFRTHAQYLSTGFKSGDRGGIRTNVTEARE